MLTNDGALSPLNSKNEKINRDVTNVRNSKQLCRQLVKMTEISGHDWLKLFAQKISEIMLGAVDKFNSLSTTTFAC